MAYTFAPSGTNIEVKKDGNTIATGTPDFAKSNFGYIPPETPAPISTPANAPTPSTAPTIPTPEAPAIQEAAMASATDAAATAKAAVEDAYKTGIADADKKIAVADDNIAGITAKQDSIIQNDINPLLQPFREAKEASERARLKVEDNYFANQKLTEELDTLLTEGNNYIKQQQGIPVNLRVVNRRVSKAMEDINARAGVIQATMAARNGQISQAYTLIDRSVNAITADRNDRLTYFKSLYDFYDTQKKDAQGDKSAADKDKKDYIAAQIKILEKEMEQSAKNAQHIKDLMVDPDTASFMARAGVTLQDTPEQVQAKMAKQSNIDEVAKQKNKLVADGYEYSPVPKIGAIEMDVNGTKMYFTPPAKAGTPTKETVYTKTTIPGSVRNDIITDLTSKEVAAAKGELTLKDLALMYPEVNTEALQELMDSFYDYNALTAVEDTGPKWWEFWK